MMEYSGRGAGTPPDYLVSANERQYLAKLCWLLHDAGTLVLRDTFDSFHPALVLKQHLGQHHIKAVLNKLRDQKILTDKQWRTLYPTKKKEAADFSSKMFDARLLSVMLQFVCHLSPPYPNGWSTLPLPQDHSLSADIVRLQMYLQQAGSLSGVRHEEYPVLWKQIVEVLLRMGGPEVRVKIARIDQETLTPEQQTHYVSLVKNSWGAPDEGALGRLRKLGAGRLTGRGGSNKRRGPGEKSSAGEEGISAEERAVVRKAQRLMCDGVMAEDIVDRLVQGHVINFGDRQEILTPGKNQDRMQILISKIIRGKSPSAFKVLMDSIKFKYPRVYEAVNKVKKIVQKEGVSEVIDVAAICQEGLATVYRSLFSRVSPLPWADTLTSIRDVYVPLDITNEEGKKLQISHLLPPVVTTGRGRRVLVEGESGSGKSYLAAMLTYQWASQQPDYFTTHYDFLIYLDARLVHGPLVQSVHSQVLPENLKIEPEEFWGLLEEHARSTVFVIDGFDEDHNHQELRELILGDKLRHASVILTSRPEARAGRWIHPDDKLYVLGFSNVNVGRCLKSYAVISQMTSQEYDDFFEIVSRPEFEVRAHLGNPYVCLAVLGIYLATGEDGLATVTTLTSLLQQFLVAVATSFCRRLGLQATDSVQFPQELVTAIGDLQRLAYRSLVTKGKLLSEADLCGVVQRLRAALEEVKAQVANEEYIMTPTTATTAAADATKNTWEADENEAATTASTVNGSVAGKDGDGTGSLVTDDGTDREEDGSSTGRGGGGRRGGEAKRESMAELTDSSLLSRAGLLTRVGGLGPGGRWVFTCSVTREFLAARYLADLPTQALEEALNEQKILRHPRFAQTASFLCGLFHQDDGSSPEALASLVKELSIQVLKHSRRIMFKDNASTTGASDDGYSEGTDEDDHYRYFHHAGNNNHHHHHGQSNGKRGNYVMNFSHCLQALGECSPRCPDLAADLVKSLPRSLVVQRDGLIPTKCLQGLTLAVAHPEYCLHHLVIDLLPYHVHQSGAFLALAEALAGHRHLQSLVVRWQSLSLVVNFLKACLARSPALHSVELQDASGRPGGGGVGGTGGAGGKAVSAATWAGLQEVGSLLGNTGRVVISECRALHLVSQWVLYLPSTARALHFPGCAFNAISAADLGSKLETSESCICLDLSDTSLENSDLAALFQHLKLNNSLQELSLAGSHVDRGAASALAEYIRLNSSLRKLDLRRCRVTDEACRALSAALEQNRSVNTLDLTDAVVGEAGKAVLSTTKEGELALPGLTEEWY